MLQYVNITMLAKFAHLDNGFSVAQKYFVYVCLTNLQIVRISTIR